MATKPFTLTLDEATVEFTVRATDVVIRGVEFPANRPYVKVVPIATLPAGVQANLTSLRTAAINSIVASWQANEPSEGTP